MGKNYTGKEDDRRYRSADVEVTYNLGRCIHARECVKGLPEVFDTGKRPWIQPDKAAAEQITEVVMRCPTGALHVIPKQGQPDEPVPQTNTIYLEKDSYLRLVGHLQIQGAGVAIEAETRAALCRCGASQNKPFCDNSHRDIDFRTPEVAADPQLEETGQPAGGVLEITMHANGPIEVNGNFELRNQQGALVQRGTSAWLCRCGGSSNKPFCDSTHKRNGFQAP